MEPIPELGRIGQAAGWRRGDPARSVSPFRASGIPRSPRFTHWSVPSGSCGGAVFSPRRSSRLAIPSWLEPQRLGTPFTHAAAVGTVDRGDRSSGDRQRCQGGAGFGPVLVAHQKGVLSDVMHNHGVQPSAARTALLATMLALRRRG
jgi:hypothetical protein